MRYIDKKQEPKELVSWKKKFKNKNKREASYNDINEAMETKSILKNSLIDEQNGLCCYCCGAIDKDNSHIEHMRPKGVSKYAKLSLEYTNLLACCVTRGLKEHCGAKKGNDFDEKLFISPLEKDCASHFIYQPYSGEIFKFKDDKKADYMITLLNLNEKVLKNARREAFYTSGILTKNESELISYIKRLNDNECRIPYCDMLLYVAEQRLVDITRREKQLE